MRTFSWTELRRQAKALSVLDRTEIAKGEINPLLVVPPDIAIQRVNELLDGRGAPVVRMQHFRLQPSEESFTGRIVWRACFPRH